MVAGAGLAVGNIKVFSVAMEKQGCIPFALLSGYKIFRTAVSMKVLSSSCKVPDMLIQF
jgi:hypothetical protein